MTPTAGLIAIDPPTQHPKAADEKPSFDRVEPPAPEVKPPAILEEDTEPAAHPAEPPVPSAGLIELPTTPAEDKKAPAEEQVSPPPVADESPREDSFLKSVEMPAAAQETPAPDHKSEPAAVAPVVDTAPEPAIIPPVPADLISLPQTSSPTPSMSPVPAGADDRASAQLTLSFEVSSLQLTPAFKLGSVQIRPLSNIVSLQLGAGHGPQPATNPLAANVSFEILSVQTGADSRIQSLVIRPLPQAQAATAPHPRLQVNAVQLTRGVENAPIQITPAQQTSTSVQVLATCTIAGIDFTPLFEIGSMRLEPNTNTVLLRLTSPQAGGADLPPVFEISSVQLGGDGQIAMVQLMPSTAQA